MAYTTPLNQALTVRLSAAEKEQLLVRAGIESRQIGQMARLLILQGLDTPPAAANAPTAPVVDKP